MHTGKNPYMNGLTLIISPNDDVPPCQHLWRLGLALARNITSHTGIDVVKIIDHDIYV